MKIRYEQIKSYVYLERFDLKHALSVHCNYYSNVFYMVLVLIKLTIYKKYMLFIKFNSNNGP